MTTAIDTRRPTRGNTLAIGRRAAARRRGRDGGGECDTSGRRSTKSGPDGEVTLDRDLPIVSGTAQRSGRVRIKGVHPVRAVDPQHTDVAIDVLYFQRCSVWLREYLALHFAHANS